MVALNTRSHAIHAQKDSVDVVCLEWRGTIPGVDVKAASGLCGTGIGYLRCESGGRISFKAPGSGSWGVGVVPPADGELILEDGADPNAWLHVDVFVDYLQPGYIAPVVFNNRYDNEVCPDDVTYEEAEDGDTAAFTVELYNAGPETRYGLLAWLAAGVDYMEISDDGVSWVAPTTEETALELGDVVAAGSVTLHLRRTIPVATDPSLEVANQIRMCWLENG